MKDHMNKYYATKCWFCNETFPGKQKLKIHICRMYIKYPSSWDYYMKGWFIRDDYIRIFSVHKETDVGMLHSENCIQSNHCSYNMPHQLISITDRFVEENFNAHACY